MVDGNIEETLDLLSVQVHSQNPTRPRGDEEVGHQFGSNWHPGLVFAILPGITVKGENCGDARRARPTQRVHHDKHLH